MRAVRRQRPQLLARQYPVDLAPLAEAADLSDGEPGDCQSGPAETACDGPFEVLGLDFPTGEPTGTPPLVRVSRIE